MSYPQQVFANLAPLTVVPDPVDKTKEFLKWANRFYEEIAFVVNSRVIPFFSIEISDVAADIPNIAQFGAFLVCVSGINSTQPVKTWSLVKSTSTAVGVINVLGTQAGSGDWAGINLTITSTATNFQIAHNLAATTGVFNISVTTTQLSNQ